MIVTVSSLYIYPDSDEPGQQLDSVEVTESGPAGNRAKKNAVHLVAVTDFVMSHPKANVVLDMEPGALGALVGRLVRLGDCVLSVTRSPSQCAGVYADVVTTGTVTVDDVLEVADDDSPGRPE
ncbi:MAG: hypothetical protein ABIS35_08955 [Terracoccus sp.]